MQVEDIRAAVKNAISDADVDVFLEGNHAHLTVTSRAFEGLTPVKKHQLVYSALQDAIASGAIHAVHIKTLTPSI
jgi:acid stress-induced BolA-like protein IbaG/YrbA